MTQRGALCTSIAAENCELMERRAALAIELGSDLVELRLDKLRQLNEAEVRRRLGRFARRSIVTLRPRSQGGSFFGTEIDRVKMISALASMSPAYVDLELETAKEHPDVLASLPHGTRRIISWHDFTGTPGIQTLRGIRKDAEQFGGHVKIVTTAKRVEDNLVTLSLYGERRSARSRELIAFCMGTLGLISRLLALRMGTPLMYASLPGESVAPGQMSITTMRAMREMWGAAR